MGIVVKTTRQMCTLAESAALGDKVDVSLPGSLYLMWWCRVERSCSQVWGHERESWRKLNMSSLSFFSFFLSLSGPGGSHVIYYAVCRGGKYTKLSHPGGDECEITFKISLLYIHLSIKSKNLCLSVCVLGVSQNNRIFDYQNHYSTLCVIVEYSSFSFFQKPSAVIKRWKGIYINDLPQICSWGHVRLVQCVCACVWRQHTRGAKQQTGDKKTEKGDWK